MKSIAMAIYLILLLVPLSIAGQERTEKIAIASEGKTIASSVGGKAARCKYFLIFDKEGQLAEVLENPCRNASSGAGSMTADFLAQEEVTLLVAGNIGYKMIAALDTKKIAHLQFSGTVEKALEHAREER
jgi:predicted Fe-Mo cluster-binding NifX family protein